MENFDINRIFKICCNSKIYITLIILVCLIAGYFYSYYYITPMYKSSATVVLIQNENLEQELAEDSSITQTDIALNKNLLSTYTKIAKSNKVLEQVIKDLSLDITPDGLASLVSVQAVNNTQVFKISVSNKDKELAPIITNHLLEVFCNEIQSLYNMNNIYTMDFAEVSNTPYNINHIKDLTIFFIIGLVLSFGLVVVIYLLDNTIKSEKDIEDYANLSVLSTIPVYAKHDNELIVNEKPKSPISECFKTFRTNVMFSIQNKKLNTILVTSGFMGEGKSFVSSNLAVAFANSGKKVILVDTDMRKGRVHKIFDLSNEQGLSTCLAKIGANGNLVNINEFIKESHVKNLHIMTAGIVPPNPSELLSSSNMIQLLEALNRQYDVVICDGTPCMLVSDSIILSKIVDTTIIVTANKSTKIDTLLNMKKSIELVGGNICGTVINKMDVDAKSYKNNYYYGEHGENDNTESSAVFEHDIILDTPLVVKELGEIIEKEQSDTNVSFEKEEVISHSNYELSDLSNTIYENTKQISELKNLYKDFMQNELDLSKKSDSSYLVLEKLEDIKNDYEQANIEQEEKLQDLSIKFEEQINSISNKISNLDFPDSSNVIIDEINNIKNDYKQANIEQEQKLQDLSIKFEEQINSISNKISNLDFPDSSNVIIDEISQFKEQYKQSIDLHRQKMLDINEKLENMENNYKNLIVVQENKIDELNTKIDILKENENKNELLEEVIKIYHQLEFMNNRFESLEQRANNNEVLIKNLSNEVKNSLYKPNHGLDIDKLNNKVIQIQDYLEKSTQVVSNSKISKKNKSVLDGQMSIIDDLLKNTLRSEETITIPKDNTKSFIVDYESVKRKQEKRGFSLFKTKDKNIVIEEEPITIVSQILLNNSESVG